jgi:hypothetical protein
MTYESFCNLHLLLQDLIESLVRKDTTYNQSNNPTTGRNAPNSKISSQVQLGCAIRCFVGGGSVYDLMINYGIGRPDVLRSIWLVIQAINNCPDLVFVFPECHQKQHLIAAGFAANSSVEFQYCVGAVDGILIWTYCPSERMHP